MVTMLVKNRLLLISVVLMVATVFFGPSAMRWYAAVQNNRDLSRLEEIVLQEMTNNSVMITNIDSRISGEQYFLFSDIQDTRVASCVFSIYVELADNSGFNANKLATLVDSLNGQNESRSGFDVRRLGKKITFTTRFSTPAIGYRIVSWNDDNSRTLAPGTWLYPLPLYDHRCRTKMYHNGH